jgi:hypothetical protein
MNEFDPDQFESELKTLRPKKPAQETVERIVAELSRQPAPGLPRRSAEQAPEFGWNLFHWLLPATAATAVAVLIWAEHQGSHPQQTRSTASSSRAGLKADQVEIDRQLVANFDAVARLPSGEPVRFRCEQWMDKVRLRDSAAGLVLERTTPRLEIVPVSFETY